MRDRRRDIRQRRILADKKVPSKSVMLPDEMEIKDIGGKGTYLVCKHNNKLLYIKWDESLGPVTANADSVTKWWEDLRVPAQNTKLNPTKSEPAFELWLDGLYAYHFNNVNADDESIHFSTQLPHSYIPNSDIEAHVHWAPNSTNTGSVVWHLEYSWANIDSAFPASSEIQVTDAASGVDNQHQVADFATISGVGKGISSMIQSRLTRLTSDGDDTFTGDAVFLEIDFHYQTDGKGSRAEYVK